MTAPERAPEKPELDVAPECAVLAVLDNARYVATVALVVSNPRVADADRWRDLDRVELLAEAIVKAIEPLQTSLRRYRQLATKTDDLFCADDDNKLF
jgi:hypothetical protein